MNSEIAKFTASNTVFELQLVPVAESHSDEREGEQKKNTKKEFQQSTTSNSENCDVDKVKVKKFDEKKEKQKKIQTKPTKHWIILDYLWLLSLH